MNTKEKYHEQLGGDSQVMAQGVFDIDYHGHRVDVLSSTSTFSVGPTEPIFVLADILFLWQYEGLVTNICRCSFTAK
jgi:hypothetical protein